MSALHCIHWPLREGVQAECKAFRFPWRRRHEAPDERCSCGIYAVQFDTLAQGYRLMDPLGLYFPVLGTVSLWGTVVATEEGWRAEFAYPKQLFVPVLGRRPQAARRLGRALERYGVSVHVLDTPAETLAEDLTELRRAA